MYRLLGGPGSPYSFKLRAVLRYRHLPHRWLIPAMAMQGGESELKVAGKRTIPVLQLPDGRYWADSTPIILSLEALHPAERSILPDDPVAAFVSHLIEDFADEYLVRVMFDMRWGDDANRQFCAERQISGWRPVASAAQWQDSVDFFNQRQTKGREAMLGLLAQAGSGGAVLAGGLDPVMAQVYRRTLQAVDTLVQSRRYFFGSRPSLADFGLYGQLSQCGLDPAASAILRNHHVRAYQWALDLDDASGTDGDWADEAAWNDSATGQLLQIIRDVYMPSLLANAQAVRSGQRVVHVRTALGPSVALANAYRETCLLWLKAELAALTPADAQRAQRVLEPFDLWQPLQWVGDERSRLTPQVPQ